MADLFRRKPGTELMEVSGIPVKVIRKRIKNLHLYVKPPEGRVEVTVPYALSERQIREFVESRLLWIQKQQEKIASREFSLQDDFLSPGKLFLWGKAYVLDLREGQGYALSLEGDRAVFTVRQGSTGEQQEGWIREWCRALLKRGIEERLPVWESLTGLRCNTWLVKDMTTRWGTCNPSAGRIWLNLQLVRKSPECLDYVLLHELAHLRIANHGADFAAFMDQYMPQWREIRKKLRD